VVVVDSELQCASVLLERFKSPDMLEAEACVSDWLMRDLDDNGEEEGEMVDEDMSMLDGKHVIPLEWQMSNSN
jgi:hypothetical protein